MPAGLMTQKDEFTNVSEGWIGVTTIDGRGDHRGVAVEPHGTVYLSEEEQIATANAPRSDDDNPFVNGTLVKVASGAEVKNRRPYGDQPGVRTPEDIAREQAERLAEQEAADADFREEVPSTETAATPVPAAEPEVGSAAPGEEVASPDAVEAAAVDAAAKPKQRRARSIPSDAS